jgi:hypothetical protein
VIEELLAGDDAITMGSQIGEAIEDLAAELDGLSSPAQLEPLCVESAVAKDVEHGAQSSPSNNLALFPNVTRGASRCK